MHYRGRNGEKTPNQERFLEGAADGQIHTRLVRASSLATSDWNRNSKSESSGKIVLDGSIEIDLTSDARKPRRSRAGTPARISQSG